MPAERGRVVGRVTVHGECPSTADAADLAPPVGAPMNLAHAG